MAFGNIQQPKKSGRSKASSPSNLESISLEDDDIPQVPIVNLERPLGVKAEKKKIEETKVQRRHDFTYRRHIECHDGRKKKNK